MRVERRRVIDAERDTVWKVVSDPDCYPGFMASLERWETLTEGPARLAARQVGRNMSETLKNLRRMVEP